MKIFLSPAKSLDFKSELPIKSFSCPVFLDESKQVSDELLKYSTQDLMSLMKISNKIAQLNFDRNQSRKYELSEINQQTRQAIYTFSGDVYSGLDPYNIEASKIDYLQDHVRLLSGLYGVLKPLDLIEAYRLEMGTKMPIGESKNLYQFWKEKVTSYVNNELSQDNEVLVNLASNEYFSVIDTKQIASEMVTPIFKEYKNDKLKVVSFYAKKARGLMTRFVVDNELTSADDLKNFESGGYRYQENLSNKKEWVFTR